jgi:hypothetical protein
MGGLREDLKLEAVRKVLSGGITKERASERLGGRKKIC